jgi:hypothetical protein
MDLKAVTRTVLKSCRRKWLDRFHRLPSVSLSGIIPAVPDVDPPLMEGICLPHYCGVGKHDDYFPLMAIARAINPKCIVELGTAYGNTVANLCRHCPEATVLTVNAPPETITGTVITFELTRDDIGRTYRQYGYADRVSQIYENTLLLRLDQHLGGRRIDLAVVDACHDTEYVINDFLKVEPHVNDGGVVLMHDTHPGKAGHLDGSTYACMALRRKGYNICHLEGTWWGVWVKGRNIAPAPASR